LNPRLSRLQRDLLDGFFQRRQDFFLTGGGALAGFHLGHRDTEDLDLFTDRDVMDDGSRTLAEVVRDLGGTIEGLRTAPDFRRSLVRRGDEAVLVDLVRDRAPQGLPKIEVGSVRIDPPAEILANKLCTLLSRGEIRDLVDVRALLATGLPLEPALELAARKDAGLTPAQLAWVLGEIRIGDDARVPAGVSPPEIRTFVERLRLELVRRAFPRDA
jgi:hypothetical protein